VLIGLHAFATCRAINEKFGTAAGAVCFYLAQSRFFDRVVGGRESYSSWMLRRSLASAVILGVGSLLSPNHLWQTAATTSGVMSLPLAIRLVKSSISGSYSSGGASSKTPRRSWALTHSVTARRRRR